MNGDLLQTQFPPVTADPLEGLWNQDAYAKSGELPCMLAVVQFGHGRELAKLERIWALSTERGADLVLIGVWRPSLCLCLSSMTCSGAAANLDSTRRNGAALLDVFASGAKLDRCLLAGLEPVGRLVDRELSQGQYSYLAGQRSDLSRRRIQRWCARHPGLAVIRF